MSVFTTVTASQLEVWLKLYDLGTLSELQGIAAGIENTNYFVTTTRGRYVLTLFEKLTTRELPFYLNLMAHLARAGVPCPAPMANRTGGFLGELNGKPASLVTRLEGKDLTQPTPDDCAKVGEVLARIHVAGQGYAARMDNPRGPAWWRSVMPDILPFLGGDDAALLREEVAWQDRQDAASLAQGAIHADLFRDNILFHLEEDEYQAVGIPPSINWLHFHAATGGYDVQVWRDDNSFYRKGDPRLWRVQVQGPGAMDVIRTATGQEPPKLKFFYMTRFKIAGCDVRALRHGMAGEPGFEMWGPWKDNDKVMAALLEAGRKHGMVQVGGRAYHTNALESGWLPRPLPAILIPTPPWAWLITQSHSCVKPRPPAPSSPGATWLNSRPIGDCPGVR